MRISDWSSDVCSSDLLPVGQHRDTVADGVERVEVVCDEEDGKAERVAQLRDELVEAGGADRVEAGGRLVEEQKLRVEREGAGDAGALLHAARQLGRDRKSTRLNSSHYWASRMPSSA